MSSRDQASTATPPDTTRCGQDLDHSGRCPFCNILLAFPPVDPLGDPQEIDQLLDHDKTNPPCVVVYSGERVLAFLDIQPLTWGHTLVIPRRHRVKMGDLEAADGAEVSSPVGFLPRHEDNVCSALVSARLKMCHCVYCDMLLHCITLGCELSGCHDLTPIMSSVPHLSFACNLVMFLVARFHFRYHLAQLHLMATCESLLTNLYLAWTPSPSHCSCSHACSL